MHIIKLIHLQNDSTNIEHGTYVGTHMRKVFTTIRGEQVNKKSDFFPKQLRCKKSLAFKNIRAKKSLIRSMAKKILMAIDMAG